MKKRYLLFAGEYYYPSGGFNDYVGSFESISDALSNVMSHHDWYHIVDLESLKIIDEDSESDDEIKRLMDD